jgi:predicted DNA-binding helix-hairpin-helix protein
VYGFIDSMVTGYKSLMRSAELSGLEEAEAELAREKEEKKAKKAALRAEKQAKKTGKPVVPTESPTPEGSSDTAPEKKKEAILGPMGFIRDGIEENRQALVQYRTRLPKFAPGGQSTQLIVGATPESDLQILRLSAGLYEKYRLKRVFFSAYIPMVSERRLPAVDTKPPLLREHRLYQADWLLRFYGFSAEELLDESQPNFDPLMDPKCNWAMRHLDQFPVDVNRADYEMLLRVPGIGVRSARRIVTARRTGALDFEGIRKLGVVLKRARYFILCSGRALPGMNLTHHAIQRALLSQSAADALEQGQQLSLFDTTKEDLQKCLSGQI